jgi:hypothetical protein
MDVGLEEDGGGNLTEYVNIPPRIGMVISCGKATLTELQTVYGLEDLYNLIEIITIDAHNQRVLRKQAERKNGDYS